MGPLQVYMLQLFLLNQTHLSSASTHFFLLFITSTGEPWKSLRYLVTCCCCCCYLYRQQRTLAAGTLQLVTVLWRMCVPGMCLLTSARLEWKLCTYTKYSLPPCILFVILLVFFNLIIGYFITRLHLARFRPVQYIFRPCCPAATNPYCSGFLLPHSALVLHSCQSNLLYCFFDFCFFAIKDLMHFWK